MKNIPKERLSTIKSRLYNTVEQTMHGIDSVLKFFLVVGTNEEKKLKCTKGEIEQNKLDFQAELKTISVKLAAAEYVLLANGLKKEYDNIYDDLVKEIIRRMG